MLGLPAVFFLMKSKIELLLFKLLIHTAKPYAQLICLPKNNRWNMSKDDNKNYGSVTVVSIITLIVSGLSIYLLINIFN